MFETVLRMSFSATLIIVALLVFRPLLKKLSSGMRAALWVMVAIRLLCPVFMESPFSLIPNSFVSDSQQSNTDTVTQNHTPEYAPPAVNAGTSENSDAVVGTTPPVVDIVVPDNFNAGVGVTPSLPEADIPEVKESKAVSPIDIAGKVWIAGIAVMAAYFAVEYLRLKRRISPSIGVEDGIRICDDINTSFIVGIINPVIYLPSNLDDRYRDIIIRHEKVHISRRDPLQKIFGYLVLSFHWFNPFVWIAYILFCKDIELACDEKVIKGKSDRYKKQYATAILYGCSGKAGISPCRVAFGEIGASQRIKNVLKYKKAKLWLVVIGVAVAVAIGVCFLTNPDSDKGSVGENNDSDETSVDENFSPAESEDVVSADSDEESEERQDDSSADQNAETESAEESAEESADTGTEEISEESYVDISESREETEDYEETEQSEMEDVTVIISQEHLSLQSNHTTTEGLIPDDDCDKYRNSERIPVYVQLYDKGRAVKYPFSNHYVMEANHPVWICDSKGKKIDYVNTNESGLAKFEVYEGSYTVFFEGTETYASYTTEVFAVEKTPRALYATPIKMYIATYAKVAFPVCTVTVLDAETGKPVSDVHVTRYKYKDSGFYTDAEGVITMPPLIEYNGNGDSFCGLLFAREGYVTQRLDADVFEKNITLRLSKLKEYSYTVKIIDADTGEGVEGVQLIVSDPADTGEIYKAVSGKDGIVSGMKDSNQLALYPQINLYYSAEGIAYERRTEEGEGLYTRLSLGLTEGDNEYTVKLKINKEDKTVTLFW